MTDINGVPTSKERIAAEFWAQDFTVAQRSFVMKQVKPAKGLKTYFYRCIEYVAENMIDYKIDGDVLTGTLKA